MSRGFGTMQRDILRAAFADKWIGLVADRLEHIWPVFYQLLKLVETEQLYARAGALHDHAPFATFQAYWEARTGRALDEWVALEQTYTYCCTYRPDLVQQLYQVAQKALYTSTPALQEGRGGAPEGNKNAAKNNHGHIQGCYPSQNGTTTTYRIARLKRDYPAIAEGLAQGEYRSVRAACLAAGLVQEEAPLTTLHRVWRKVRPEDRLRFLTEMLTTNERRALTLGFDDEEESTP